ncbi:MAG: hypothetical protein ABIR06_14780 [Cyclobacteriaceae bacterium]
MHRLFLMLFSLLLVAFDQPKLVKTKVTDDISISIPKDWKPMDGLDFTERYPSVRAPLGAYTNAERNADLSINISATRWPDTNLEMAQRFFKSSLSNMVDRIQMIHEGSREINGKKFIYFEFESRVNGNKSQLGNADPILKYTYLQYLIEPHRTIVFSFNCSRADRPAWENSAAAMMKSIKIK